MKNKPIWNRKINKKLCNLLNEIVEEEFKKDCKHPKKYLRELPGQDNIYLYNREAKCLKCGAILIGYLGRKK
ncbi:hypothetical protein ES703_06716 [subsurface metagenome]